MFGEQCHCLPNEIDFHSVDSNEIDWAQWTQRHGDPEKLHWFFSIVDISLPRSMILISHHEWSVFVALLKRDIGYRQTSWNGISTTFYWLNGAERKKNSFKRTGHGRVHTAHCSAQLTDFYLGVNLTTTDDDGRHMWNRLPRAIVTISNAYKSNTRWMQCVVPRERNTNTPMSNNNGNNNEFIRRE